MRSTLQWELDWIDANSHLYLNPEVVKENIARRYLLNHLTKLLRVAY